MSTTLHIKNMVCNRCIKVVREDVEQLGLEIEAIRLGELVLKDEITDEKKQALQTVLQEDGFELLDDRKAALVEKIKNIIIREVHHSQERWHENFSHLIADELHMD